MFCGVEYNGISTGILKQLLCCVDFVCCTLFTVAVVLALFGQYNNRSMNVHSCTLNQHTCRAGHLLRC